jgi:hypothetical protein
MKNLNIFDEAGCGSLPTKTQASFSQVARSAIWVDRALRIGMASAHADGSLSVGAKTVLKRPISTTLIPQENCPNARPSDTGFVGQFHHARSICNASLGVSYFVYCAIKTAYFALERDC